MFTSGASPHSVRQTPVFCTGRGYMDIRYGRPLVCRTVQIRRRVSFGRWPFPVQKPIACHHALPLRLATPPALTADEYRIAGRARFKEEFVTCGGVALSGIDLSTQQSKLYPGLYFAGEVLDIDAVTGGFNLQAAWSMGWRVARKIMSGSEV